MDCNLVTLGAVTHTHTHTHTSNSFNKDFLAFTTLIVNVVFGCVKIIMNTIRLSTM